MDKQYWEKFYKENEKMKQSSFAELCIPYMNSHVIELGCGNGRDLEYFSRNNIFVKGVDQSYENSLIIKMDVGKYMEKNKCNGDVYTRFFWHSIDKDLRLKILEWAQFNLFIEARTTEDTNRKKIFNDHYRNYVDIVELVKDLKENGFQIILLKEGTGMSKFKDEDPHLVRVIAKKLK